MKVHRLSALVGTPPTCCRPGRTAPAAAAAAFVVRCQQPPPNSKAEQHGKQGSNTWSGQQLKPAAASTASERLARGRPQPGAAAAEPPPVAVAAAGDAEEQQPAPATVGAGGWVGVPARYKLLLATSLSFVICNMDKVNISVAIIPMAQDFGWSPTVAGLVQSSFFWGYLLSQIPGGVATSMFGGRTVLPAGVALWSVATAGVPLLAGTLPGLFVSRAAVGLGEGVAPSAATDMVARCIPTEQRGRAISFIFGGLHVGSLLGLLIAPACIQRFGWPSVFYLFGGVGVCWTLWWERLLAELKVQDPELVELLTSAGGVAEDPPTPAAAAAATATLTAAAGAATTAPPSQQQRRQLGDSAVSLGGTAAAAAAGGEAEAMAGAAGHGGHGGVIDVRQPVPWRSFLRNGPLRALAYAHFCNNWFHYTMLAWLPTYFTSSLSLDLGRAAQVSLLPPVAAIAVSALAGPTADALIARGVPVVTVRKAAQVTAFMGPATCLATAGHLEDGLASVVLVTLSLGLASFSLAGLYCNHADLSPRYASVLLGMTNTSGALPGIVGVAFTGFLYDQTGSWSWALFAPSIFLFLTGSAVYLKWASADRQGFGESNNQPFAFERWLGLGGTDSDGDGSSGGSAQPQDAAEKRHGE